MRDAFCRGLVSSVPAAPDFVFLTGDLGFKALEPLRDALGARFINAGVAEQNMVSTAAGLARGGLRPWCYSIAPFIYARPFEQIRNDACLHDLPVVLVGNGGGYGYGVMGATHHAIEDYGVLLALQYLRAYVPAFDEDLSPILRRLMRVDHPAYLRLGVSELPKGFAAPGYAPWRRLTEGDGATILVVGPLVGGIVAAATSLPDPQRPTIWLLCELPIDEMPADFLADLARSQHLIVVEEHVAQGGVGTSLAAKLLDAGLAPRRFAHRHARGYPSGRYGSQRFHRAENGLDAAAILALAGEGR